MFGVEIHANTIGNLIHDDGLNRFPQDTELGILMVSLTILGAFAARQVGLLTLGVISAGVAGVLAAGYCAFAYYHFWVANLGVFTIGYLVTLVVSAVLLYRRSSKHKQYLDETFRFEQERGM